MKSIRQIYNKIINILSNNYTQEESKNIASILIADILKLSRPFEIFLYFKNNFPAEKEKILETKIKKLQKNYPLQYITHKVEFGESKFFVSKGVFIPRPETEELCYIVKKEIDNKENYKIIDLCTGSGCIAITLKKFFFNSEIYAIDIDDYALKVAQCNAMTNKVNVTFIKDDLLNIKYTYCLFDVIVSNPPYIPLSQRNTLPKNVKFEPDHALFVPDDDPLIYYKAIFKFADKYLKPKGSLFLELNENFYNDVYNLFNKAYICTVLKDFKEKYRFLKAIKK